MVTDQLIQKYPIISRQITAERLRVILRHLELALVGNTAGDIVEFGCYIGATSLFLRRMCDAYQQSDKKSLHVYDSFEGLPHKQAQDNSVAGDQFKAGELKVNKKQLFHEFYKAKLRPPVVHKAWFYELSPADIPKHIAFAFLDGDFYSSILNSLQLITPALSPTAIVAIDDFGRESLPGVERAVRDFFNHNDFNVHVEHNIAIIKT